ncbi:MAG: lipoprotein insertase outer membrane protein LolB [Rhodoferax sp.]|nr:lipoprotein insertase outer membrane protein LolB [Rhodoferax sp.]
MVSGPQRRSHRHLAHGAAKRQSQHHAAGNHSAPARHAVTGRSGGAQTATLRHICAWVCVVFATFLLAACAIPTRATRTFDAIDQWQGRIAIKVAGDTPQSLSADFELGGDAQTGSLLLLSPLGTTVAQLEWAPGVAQLRQGSSTQQFASLDALVLQATGTELPVAALFDWLHGTATEAPGWRVDLQELPQGKLQAWRDDSKAPASLRILLAR